MGKQTNSKPDKQIMKPGEGKLGGGKSGGKKKGY